MQGKSVEEKKKSDGKYLKLGVKKGGEVWKVMDEDRGSMREVMEGKEGKGSELSEGIRMRRRSIVKDVMRSRISKGRRTREGQGGGCRGKCVEEK